MTKFRVPWVRGSCAELYGCQNHRETMQTSRGSHAFAVVLPGFGPRERSAKAWHPNRNMIVKKMLRFWGMRSILLGEPIMSQERMLLPFRWDYLLFLAGVFGGVFGCIEVNLAATGKVSSQTGIIGYILLAFGTGLFLAGMWLLARPTSETPNDKLNSARMAIAPGPAMITAGISRLGNHLANHDAVWLRLALVVTGTFLNALWVTWLLKGIHRLPTSKDDIRAAVWGLCLQLGATCFMWAMIPPKKSAAKAE